MKMQTSGVKSLAGGSPFFSKLTLPGCLPKVLVSLVTGLCMFENSYTQWKAGRLNWKENLYTH